MTSSLEEAVARFGKSAKNKMDNPGAEGQPEDQLRNPLEMFFKDLARVAGLPEDSVVLVGENSLAQLMVRPDFAVTLHKALIGHIEVKAPGKGADPRKFTGHDKEQWEKLKALPNLIYTDGQAFSLWRDGEKVGEIVHLEGDIETAGGKLKAPPGLAALVSDFLSWNPIALAPKTPQQLAKITARLCRLLRDEVEEQLALEAPALTGLREDWRQMLLPEATDKEFADGYAQAVTFGLLMAKARGITLADGLDGAGKALKQTNTLIGTALNLLTGPAEDAKLLETSTKTLVRVLDVVNWQALSKGEPEAWLYFYELFLQRYDPKLRKKTGSYYTPPDVVTAMVRLVDEALASPGRFNLPRGLASQEVKLADPAVGTGTFLLGVLNRIARTVEAAEGKGSVPAALQDALKRLIGFELQFGPFAVAQLRLLAELFDQVLSGDETDEERAKVEEVLGNGLRLYITDTLADPDEATPYVPTPMKAFAQSRIEAGQIKRKEAIDVVLGNPPYKEKAKGMGGWVEDRGPGLKTPLDDWQPPVAWGVSAHAKHLRNLYVYFWRWAAWKVFGGDNSYRSGADKDEAKDWSKRQGIVCFITVAGFLNGPGFQKMRADLRRDADEIWVIDCSPEGHMPAVSTRIFEAVKQPVCIVMALRKSKASPDTPARVRFRALPEGPRKEKKFTALSDIGLDDGGWVDCPSDPRAPFLPPGAAAWVGYPALEDLFSYNGSGVMTGRTWVIAPEAQSLRDRWTKLTQEKDPVKKALLFHPHLRKGKLGDKHVEKVIKAGLTGHEARTNPVSKDTAASIEPTPYAFRSFDRQWITPDARLINQPNPKLWKEHSERQVYATAPHDQRATSGPALTLTALVPDLHHYNGRGGRVLPLWADAAATKPNVSPGLLKALGEAYGCHVGAEDVMAYIAAVASHPAYVTRFRDDLKQPGLRIPITADGGLFAEAVAVGREIIWLHTFGERFQDDRGGEVRVTPAEDEPTVSKALPKTLAEMPHDLIYDAAERALKFGPSGRIDHVSPAVRAYEVSGKVVLDQWWSYRRADRSKPQMGQDKRPPSALAKEQPIEWLSEYTSELVKVLRVLTRLVALEPAQADLLTRIVNGATLDADDLRESGALTEGSAEDAAQAEDVDHDD